MNHLVQEDRKFFPFLRRYLPQTPF
jgi:hypothetical protein